VNLTLDQLGLTAGWPDSYDAPAISGELFARLEKLSDGEVEYLLKELLKGEEIVQVSLSPEADIKTRGTGDYIFSPLDNPGELLTRLDQLLEEEVDGLLDELLEGKEYLEDLLAH
jgi:hypothetical protein